MDFKVSVIVPVYNASQFIEKAVDSIIQCKEVDQVILVEDCSTDNSLELCQALQNKYEIVELYQHPDKGNHGAGATRNVALDHVKNDYIAFLDADDFYTPTRFDVTKEVFEKHNNATGVYEAIGTHFYNEEAKAKYTKNEFTTINNVVPPEGFFDEFLLGKGFASLDGITVKRSFMQSLGKFDVNLRQSQDTDMVMRMAWKGSMYSGSLDKAVTIRGVHENNRIHNKKAAYYYAGMLAAKWLDIMASNKFSKAATYKIFYRAINNQNVKLDNGNKLHQPIKKILLAFKYILRYPNLLFKMNLKDVINGFRSGFK